MSKNETTDKIEEAQIKFYAPKPLKHQILIFAKSRRESIKDYFIGLHKKEFGNNPVPMTSQIQFIYETMKNKEVEQLEDKKKKIQRFKTPEELGFTLSKKLQDIIDNADIHRSSIGGVLIVLKVLLENDKPLSKPDIAELCNYDRKTDH